MKRMNAIRSAVNAARRQAVRGDARHRPIASVQIELTNHCNYRCRFCPQAQYRKPEFAEVPFDRDKGYMDEELYRHVLDQAYHYAREINFSFFGEPMMHPDFLRFLDLLKDRPSDLRVVMNTNLSYATRDHFDKLIEIHLDELRISIDAATPETYDIVRPGKHFVSLDGAVREGFRFDAITAKVEHWFRRSDHRPTRHVYTVNSRNLDELEAYVRRWGALLGSDDVILAKNVLTYGGKIDDTMIRAHPCNVWDSAYLTVDWRGVVSPCNLDTNMDLAIGSIRDATMIELHESRERQRLQALSKARSISPCRTCVDANNWERNVVFRRGEVWDETIRDSFLTPNESFVPLSLSAVK